MTRKTKKKLGLGCAALLTSPILYILESVFKIHKRYLILVQIPISSQTKKQLTETSLVRLMSLKLKEIMIKDVITVEAKATVKTAVELMNKHEIGCLIVAERGKAVGIVTERDILKRVIPKLEDPEKMKVSEIMSKPLSVGKPQMDISKAVKIMFKKKIKKLPVVEHGRLVGLVTLTDLVRSPNIMRLLEGPSHRKDSKGNEESDQHILRRRRLGQKMPACSGARLYETMPRKQVYVVARR